jgi:parvulin-like peptidyl-prolyl isomerase
MANFPVRRSIFAFSKDFLVFPVLVLAGAALLAGCHPAAKKAPVVTNPTDPAFVVAEKGDWQITRSDLDKEIASILKQHQVTAEQVGAANMPKVEGMAIKSMVLTKLIMARAATLPLKDVDKDEATQLDAAKQSIPPGQNFDQLLKAAGLTMDDVKKQIHEKVVINKVLDAEAFKNDDPTDQEINDFFLKNKEKMTTPPQVRASRILVHIDEKATPADKAAKKKAIDKARDRIVHGEDFSKVALQVSEDQSSKAKGGDIDYFRPGENEPGFDQVAFNTKQGAVSPVFETSLGYQFLKVTDVKPGGEASLADIRPKIAAYLRNQKMKDQAQTYTTKLLADSGVNYHVAVVDPTAPDAAPASSAQPAPPAQTPPPAQTAPAAQAAPAAPSSAPSK